jgi:hypothetical protein
VMVSQKLLPVFEALSKSVAESDIERLTVIGASGGQPQAAAALVPLFEQFKHVLGVDVAAKLRELAPVHDDATPRTDPEP